MDQVTTTSNIDGYVLVEGLKLGIGIDEHSRAQRFSSRIVTSRGCPFAVCATAGGLMYVGTGTTEIA